MLRFNDEYEAFVTSQTEFGRICDHTQINVPLNLIGPINACRQQGKSANMTDMFPEISRADVNLSVGGMDDLKDSNMMLSLIEAAPFHLEREACDWVMSALSKMDTSARVRQLFVHFSSGNDPGEAQRIADLAPAGIVRFFGTDGDAELQLIEEIHELASFPLLVGADLEGSRTSPPFATDFPNALSLAAINDLAVTRAVAETMAREALAGGVNWALAPVLDINAAFRSPIVGTRSFGSDLDIIKRQTSAHIDAFQKAGMAATAKHWPGEGHDDRDQHLLTTSIPLTVQEWQATHGSMYAAAIEAGVLSIMSGHISFPAFVEELDQAAGVEAFRPASLSKVLNTMLLRGKFGFNGVIVSDATIMGGYRSWGRHRDILPDVVANGCDIILFSDDPEADFRIVMEAVESGRITEARLEEAVLRILALKAALGFHRKPTRIDRKRLKAPDATQLSQAAFASVPTLVKDARRTPPFSSQIPKAARPHDRDCWVTWSASTAQRDQPA